MNLENKILRGLINNKEYRNKVLPFLKKEYFTESESIVFGLIFDHLDSYSNPPTTDILNIELDGKSGLNQNIVDGCKDILLSIEKDKSNDDAQWLIDATESHCKDKALYNAITNSIEIINGEKQKLGRGAIPEILSDALAVSFDSHVGHDWLEDWEERFDFYHMKENKIPFDLDYLNKITKNGVAKKSLNIIMASTGVGKSMLLCHLAAGYMTLGKNVLYISMEMSEEAISERIDANMMNIEIDDIKALPRDVYKSRMERFNKTITGKMIAKQYPTASASVLDFKALLTELRIKKNFKPDVLIIDYLNICASSRIVASRDGNTYSLVKMIAEEVRGMGVEYDIPVWSATQVNRGGHQSSDIELDDVSESWGLTHTADLLFSISTNEELDENGMVMFKQLKNRYGDLNYMKRGLVGVNRGKMKFFDVANPNVGPGISKSKPSHSSLAPSMKPEKHKSITETSLREKFKGIKT